MSEGKHTPGEWFVWRNGFSTVYVEARIGGGRLQEVAACGPTAGGPDEQAANAHLIAEAGTVRHETGLTPRQLVEQRDALVNALEAMVGFCDEHADFRNGVTDPTGAIDEGNVAADQYFRIARAALAVVKGETP